MQLRNTLLLMFVAGAVLSGCSTADEIEHTKAAECSRLGGKIIEPPSSFNPAKGNFLSDSVRRQQADDAREIARRTGCQ